MFEGKKVAFIASGGAGRGVAHTGVLKACKELDIKFDMLIGASAGAICAAFYAQHKDPDRLLDMFKPASQRIYRESFGWDKMISFKNFFSTKIKTGLFDTTAAEQYFKESLFINSFDELDIPLYISATNINTGKGEIFGPGTNVSISKAIVASSCVPIIFRPVRIGEHYYIDGEIKRPTAVNNAFELGADVAIVSDIYRPYTKNIENTNMFNIFGQMANMVLEDKSMRGIKIARSKFPNKEIILISPNVGNISPLNTSSYKKLNTLGYNAAMKELIKYGQ